MRTYFILGLFITISLTACKNKSPNFEHEAILKTAPSSASDKLNEKSAAPENPKQEQPQPSIEKNTKIIKDGQVEIEVSEISSAKSTIDAIVKKNQAYYELDEFSANDYSSNYTLKVRIKAEHFDVLVNSILNLGNGATIKHKNINARDVTMEYIDTESRMKSAKAYVVRYKDLLSKARTIKDILELENIIQQKQAEIESHEGRLKYMTDQIAYSTLSLTLTQKHEYFAAETKMQFGQKLVNSAKQGFDVVLSIILGIVTLWPFVVIIGAIIVFRKRLWWWWKK